MKIKSVLLLVPVIATLSAASQALSQDAPQAEQPAAVESPREAEALAIIDRFVEVTGGSDAYSTMKNRYVESTISGAGQFALTRQWAIAPNKLFVEVDVTGQPTSRQVYDGEVAFSPIDGDRYDFLLGRRDRDMRADAEILTYADHERVYPLVVLVEPEELEGVACDRVFTRSIHGKFERHWFSRETGLLVALESSRADGTGRADAPIFIRFEDYKDYTGEGFLFPEIIRQQQQVTGPEGQRGTIELTIRNLKVEFNVDDLPDFSIPEELSEETKQVKEVNERWQTEYQKQVLAQQQRFLESIKKPAEGEGSGG